MATRMQTLLEHVTLKNGVIAKIALQPMPTAGEDGTYPLLRNVDQTAIYLTFERDGKPFAKRSWEQVITGEKTVTLNEGCVLDEDDLFDLDDEGWKILFKYGLIPTAFV